MQIQIYDPVITKRILIERHRAIQKAVRKSGPKHCQCGRVISWNADSCKACAESQCKD